MGHLASYARINEYGFIETPYRKVVKDASGRRHVTSEIEYLNAFTEEKVITASATTPVDEDGYFINPRPEVRRHGEPGVADASEIDYMDVSWKQSVSIGTALIPFLEHDDTVRALMGTNMQRQAVP